MRSGRGSSSVGGKGRRRGTRCIVRVPHDGHTSGRWSRSAAMSAKASGARNSLMPLRPTDSPPTGESSPFLDGLAGRSEEHTSELQSLRHLVCRLLLEKKKKK